MSKAEDKISELRLYPSAYNPILEYWHSIQSGETVVGRKIKETYRKIIRDMEDKESPFRYSPKRANHILEFAENYCRLSKGKGGGKLVNLELWEKAMLATIFGFVDKNGLRKYREAVLIVGKKNGKSLIASIVGLYLMVGDSEPGAEVYAVATKKDQAKIIWSEARRMVRKSPVLLGSITTHIADMECEANDSVYKPLASDSDTLDGLNVHGALMDEIHQWKNGRPLYDIIADGVTAREQPLIFITSTAGVIREDIYDEKYEYSERVINGYSDPEGYKDERFIAFIYELDKREEWREEVCWKKANPGLGTIKNLETLRDKVQKAKQNSSLIKNLVCKEFNIRETSTEAWLNFDDLNNTATFDPKKLKPRYGIGGVDLSATTDLTAAKVLFMVPGGKTIYALSMYWIPEDLVEQRIMEDHVPYDKWIDGGYVRTCPGNKIDYHCITKWFVEIQKEMDVYISYVGYDEWGGRYWADEMAAYFGPNVMIPVRQGKKTLSSPMKALGADLAKKVINYNNNPVDKWCLSNVVVEEDKNGNIQPHKSNKPTRRIDGAAALLDAYVILTDKIEEYTNNL